MLESKQMKAHVQDGQVVLDEPLDFPEGARLRVVLDEVEDRLDPEIEEAWMTETLRRRAEWKAGRVEALPVEKAIEQMFAKP